MSQAHARARTQAHKNTIRPVIYVSACFLAADGLTTNSLSCLTVTEHSMERSRFDERVAGDQQTRGLAGVAQSCHLRLLARAGPLALARPATRAAKSDPQPSLKCAVPRDSCPECRQVVMAIIS